MAKRIPEYFIQDILARIDIVDLIKARVPIKRRGANYLGNCPFHQEKTPSFTVSQPKQFYHCFGCGKHGNAFGFLMDYENLGFVEAVEELAKTLGLEVPHEGNDRAPREKYEELYALMQSAQQFFEKNLREHPAKAGVIDYLKKRGVTGKSAKYFGLGFAPDSWDALLKHLKKSTSNEELLIKTGLLVQNDQKRVYDRFRNRIMFPIRDSRGRVIAFGGRVIERGEPKYLNSPETPIFHKGQTLYGWYEVKNALKNKKEILIVEGYMDVLMLHQTGVPYAVATLGTATTPDHIRLLLKEARVLNFCFDGDRAGREAAWRALRVCLSFMTGAIDVRFLFLPENEDPDSLIQKEGKKAFEERLQAAPALGEFLLSECAKSFDLRSIGGKSQYLSELKPYFEKIPVGAYRLMLESSLAKRLSLLEEQIQTLWAPQEKKQHRLSQKKNKNLSLLEKTLALILVYPQLVQKFKAPTLNEAQAEAMLLRNLWQFCKDMKPTHFGMILEHFSEAPEHALLLELGKHPYTEMIQNPEAELEDMLPQLQLLEPQARLDSLLHKARGNGLDLNEKAELKLLLSRN